MLKNLLNKKRQEGFSIVEVMIVLAIAGLIILVVFLAVPALQRNSRNTTRKSDVGSIGSIVSEFQGSNNGKNPTTAALANGEVTISSTVSGTTPVKTTVGNGIAGVSIGTAAPGAANPDNVVIVIGSKCNGAALGSSSARSVAILFNLETASGIAPQCLEA